MQIADFLGKWRIQREIVEASGAVHRLTGTAQFTAETDGFLYREDGVLVTDRGAPFAASRVYHWRDIGSGRVQVLFEDGRTFHKFDLEGAKPAADHWCDPDIYHVSYNFGDWPRWTTEWSVSGPRKDYRMVTRYWR